MGNKIGLSLVALVVSVLITLGLSEAILRLSGYAPQKNVPLPNVPISKQPDPVLGWKNKPGRYVYPAFVTGLPEIRLTVGEDRTRVTGSSSASGGGLAFFGCSYTEGEHINDEETMAWKLQSRYPDVKVTNYGVAGYGTYQSELLLRQVLARPNPPKKVLYGFMEHHEARNVAHPIWLKSLSGHSTEGEVALPFATLDDEGHLLKPPHEKYPQWPLAEHLATVAFAQDWYVKLKGRKRESQEIPVTQALIREMNDDAKKQGIEFAVVLLYGLKPEGRSQYVNFFERHGIEYYDCQQQKTSDLVVPGEGHPNGKLNTLWAKCIAKSLEAEASSQWIPRKEWAEREAGPAIISQLDKNNRP